MRNPAKAIFCKRTNGDWAICVTRYTPTPGQEFSIRKANGDVSTVTVERVIESRANGDSLCSIVARREVRSLEGHLENAAALRTTGYRETRASANRRLYADPDEDGSGFSYDYGRRR